MKNLESEYDFLTNKLDEFLELHFEDIKAYRDMSVHFDKKSINVYDSFVSLDIEVIFNKLIPFLDIINNMFVFTELIIHWLQINNLNEKMIVNKKIDDFANSFDNLKNDNNVKALQTLKEKILSLKNLFK